MATFVLTDAIIYVDDFDYTGVTNKVALKASVDFQDSTVFGGGGYRSRKGGLRSIEMDVDGYQDNTSQDLQSFSDIGIADRPSTVAAVSIESTPAFMFLCETTDYQPFGKVGEMAPFALKTTNTDQVGLIRGQVAKAKGNVSTTGVLGSGIQLPAGAAGKFVYATFHVFTVGTTITVQVQRGSASNFPAPVTVATIGPLTTVGGTWMTRVDSTGITDTWWRFNVSAITGTFNVSGAIAVQ